MVPGWPADEVLLQPRKRPDLVKGDLRAVHGKLQRRGHLKGLDHRKMAYITELDLSQLKHAVSPAFDESTTDPAAGGPFLHEPGQLAEVEALDGTCLPHRSDYGRAPDVFGVRGQIHAGG